MFRLFFLIFLLLCSLDASQNDETLKRATTLLQSKDQGDIFRAYNDYKSLYLVAIVENDDGLRAESLKGIVSSGKKLNIDISNYERELKNTHQNQDIKKTKSTITTNSVDIKPQNRLKSTKWDDNTLFLLFDSNIDQKNIRFTTLHEKNRFRYIFDIDLAMITNTHNISKSGIDSIKVVQFNPKSIRVVVQNISKVDITYKVADNSLAISLGSSKAILQKEKPLSNKINSKTIVIDAGHGGDDPGAIGFKKYREKDIVFAISKEVARILKSRGHKVFMTRDRDVFVKLSERTKFANKKNADIFVSIHANAMAAKSNIKGIETYFLSPSRSDRAKNVAAAENSADLSDMNMYGKDSYLNLLNHHNILASNKLAIDVQRGVLAAVSSKFGGVEDNGVKEGPFWVLVGAAMPSILIEVGFVSNEQEVQRLINSTYQQTIATGLANGIERYFANN